jgi:hypothetical protein
VPLVERGARVIGIDISTELIALAQQRLALAKLEATVQVGSAYRRDYRTHPLMSYSALPWFTTWTFSGSARRCIAFWLWTVKSF